MAHLLYPLFLSLVLLLLLLSTQLHARQILDNAVVSTTPPPSSTTACPLNFTTLNNLIKQANVKPSNDVATNCQYISEGLRLVLSLYLRSTNNSFYPPPSSAESCWNSYQSLVDSFIPNFNIRNSCNFSTSWMTHGCMNISTRSEFEKLVPQLTLNDAISNCNQSLENSSPCASCLTSITTLQGSYFKGPSVGSIVDCTNLPLIYAGGLLNQYGPSDPGTAKCLFSLDFSAGESSNSWKKKKKVLISVVTVAGFVLLCGIFGGYVVFLRVKVQREVKKQRRVHRVKSGLGSRLSSSIDGSTHLVKFSMEELKLCTKNFHRDNLIGKGGYGNVYKGVLPNGTEVAIKRFKNCSAAGEESFEHEVQVIASIRHVNLVELKGYCAATTRLEGHQRIIVCDLMKNGSLHDHLFGLEKKLSWPVRQKIALGMARGLSYLHYGAQPAIIHRDIKASNILLDDDLEAKVCDFGLAKFNPEGFTHLSTRVAGTMGYVAPEYALYGQLTERSDVYSFGVVLLELLSGKKAILCVNEGQQPSLVTDWAWSLVRKGHALDVIEEGMPELGADEVMEKYVMIAVLCSHPQLYARPTMDQVVKILETDLPVPSIPERPIPLIAELEDIHRSATSSASGHLSTTGGFQSFVVVNFDEHGETTAAV